MESLDKIKRRFIRSTNITADNDNNDLIDQIVITEQIIKTFRAVSEVINDNSNEAAISIIGPYGSGKSTTILLLCHYLLRKLPIKIDNELVSRGIKKPVNKYSDSDIYSVIGTRDSLNEILNQIFDTDNVIEHLSKSLKKDKNRKFVLLIDEFGKFLEYTTNNNKVSDIYILQRLAELAHRSNGRFILLTVRHQAMTSYLKGIKGSELDEWRKIQGRFIDIVHSNSLNETLLLIHTVLKDLFVFDTQLPKIMIESFSDNYLLSEDSKKNILSYTSPINPFALLLLVSSFKRFAQNERSIHSFLMTQELYGLRHFLAHNKDLPYQISDLYDYIVSNLNHVMFESEISSSWSMINSSLALFKSNIGPNVEKNLFLQSQYLIKAIGMINLFGPDVGIKATKKVLKGALFGHYGRKSSKLNNLAFDLLENGLGIANYRKLDKSYYLWHGSDINISKLINEHLRKTTDEFDYANTLNSYFRSSPIVARKLHIERGTLRYATWQYVNSNNVQNLITDINKNGVVYCIVGESLSKKDLTKYFKNVSIPANIVITVLDIDNSTKEIIKTFHVIERLLETYQPLHKDHIARSELQDLSRNYHNLIENKMRNTNLDKTQLFHLDNNYCLVTINRSLLGKIVSNALDKYYHLSPTILNELINTDKPSPSVMVGIKSLLYAMLNNPDKQGLGIVGSGPDYSIYLNVIKQTGIHRRKEKGWVFAEPNNADSGLTKVWELLDKEIKDTAKNRNRISIGKLQESLSEPPYGVKNGLANILIFAFLSYELKNISIYENGSFTPKIMKDTLERVLRKPHNFDLQYIEIDGVHFYLFNRLFEIINDDRKDVVTLLDVVTPFIQFANRLPRFTKRTKTLRKISRDVLDALLSATSPENLIYESLPQAMGFDPFYNVKSDCFSDETINRFLEKLEECYHEIRTKRESLINECLIQFGKIWGIESNSLSGFRKQIRDEFSDDLVGVMTDITLRSYVSRIMDTQMNDEQWLISVVSLLANKPIDQWLDSDVITFSRELKLKYFQIDELKRLVKIYKLNEPNVVDEKIKKIILDIIKNIDADEVEILKALRSVYDNYLLLISNNDKN